MQQNLFWATGYNAVAIPLAAGVASGAGILLSPAVGAVLMSLSTIVVALNAQLLRRREAALRRVVPPRVRGTRLVPAARVERRDANGTRA